MHRIAGETLSTHWSGGTRSGSSRRLRCIELRRRLTWTSQCLTHCAAPASTDDHVPRAHLTAPVSVVYRSKVSDIEDAFCKNVEKDRVISVLASTLSTHS